MNKHNDEDLNFLAIAIFTLAMSVLIGPVIGLSPLIPAIMTAILLGLYGIYASGWGERSLLMAWWQETSPQQRDRLLHHEAGHFLVAYLLGIKIRGYNLSPVAAAKQGQFGVVGVEVDADLTKPGSLERYCTVWMAGIAAEEYIYQDAKGGAEDIRQLRHATAHLPNPELHQRWALLRARTLIAEHQEAYQALVLQMQQNAAIENCYAAIDLTLSRKAV